MTFSIHVPFLAFSMLLPIAPENDRGTPLTGSESAIESSLRHASSKVDTKIAGRIASEVNHPFDLPWWKLVRSALVIDLKANKLVFYRNGKAIFQWNVVTGDHTKDHGTPRGVFEIEAKVENPAWTPKGVLKSRGGESNNPLGNFWIQFNSGNYGLHGTNAPGLLQQPYRDLSNGCIRNGNPHIKFLFGLVEVGTPLVIGLFDHYNPQVPDCTHDVQICRRVLHRNTAATDKIKVKSYCGIDLNDPNGIARVRSAASTQSEVVRELPNKNLFLQILDVVEGESFNGTTLWAKIWFKLGGVETTGYIHSSLLKCSLN